MGFGDLRVTENSIKIGITELIQSFFNSKKFFANEISENEQNIFNNISLNSVESHKQFFNENPLKYATYELPVNYRFKYKRINIELNGRIDAYSEKDGIVYELKITEREINELIDTGSINLFKIQLFIYGYILKKKKKEVKTLKLIIASTKQNLVKEFKYQFDLEEVYKQIKKIFPFLYDLFIFEKSKSRFQNIEPIFPYPELKPTQKEIINNLLNSEKFITFIEAPFASGKTSAALYALAKRYNIPQIHYFTSRNVQKKQVVDEGEKIGYKSILRKSFTDTCKFSYLFCKKYNCKLYLFPLEKYSILNLTGCPVIYEKLFYNMFDLIVSDYNYLFYKALSKTKNTICVIDEYHSFLNRLKDFFTISIKEEEIKRIKELFFIKYKLFYESFLKLINCEEFAFESHSNESFYIEDSSNIKGDKAFYYKENYIDEIIKPINPDFIKSLADLVAITFEYINENTSKNLLEFENEIYPFLIKIKSILELSQFEFVISYSKIKNEKIFTYKSIKPLLINLFSGYRNIIGISATLEPKELLYNVHEKDDFLIYSKNIPKKIRTFIYKDLETTYKKREKNAYPIAKFINQIIIKENKEGELIDRSILIFFPSYEFIRLVEVFINDPIYDKIMLTRDNSISNLSLRVYNGEINDLENFFIKKKIHLIFLPYRSTIQEGANLDFNIAGGIFVGLPFRVPDNQFITHSILMDQYMENPFEMLSLFPALNDLLQSSGRIGRKKDNNNFLYFIGKEFLNNKVYDSISDCYENIKIL